MRNESRKRGKLKIKNEKIRHGLRRGFRHEFHQSKTDAKPGFRHELH
jgi:hypothetical protein